MMRVVVGADSLPSIHDYNAQASAPAPRDEAWTPIGFAEHGKDSVQLQEFGGMRKDREIQIPQPENAYHRM